MNYRGTLRDLLSGKTLLLLFIIIGCGYLVTKFPDESILIGGIGIVCVMGIWLWQAYHSD